MGWQDDEVVTSPTAQADWQQDEIVQQPATEPSMLDVAGNAAWKGIAGTGDFLLNVAGAAGEGLIPYHLRPKAMKDPLRTGLETVGAIRPENEPQTAGQRILDMAVQAGVSTAINPTSSVGGLVKNAVIGTVSGLAGGVTKEATGSDLAATAATVATPLLIHGAASLGAKANAPTLANPTKTATLKDAQAAGYVVPPSQVKPSAMTNKLEGIAGKAAIRQEAAIRNQEVTNTLAAKALGLPEGTHITEGVLEHIREQSGKVYEKLRGLVPGGELRNLRVATATDRPMLPGPATGLKISKVQGDPLTTGLNVQELRNEEGLLQGMKIRSTSMGQEPGALERLGTKVTSRGQDIPGALEGMRVKVKEIRGGSPVDELKQARADAKTFYRHNAISGDPASLKKANILTKRAMEIENQLERAAVASGNHQLITEFREARALIAKTHAIESALNVGDGNINARMLGRMLDKGQPLTGELNIIGRFANAFPSVTREGAAVPASGVSGTDAAASAILGTVGYGAAGGPTGLVAAGLPLLRGVARPALLSGMYQKRLLAEPPELNQALLRSILAGRATAEAQP